MNTAAAESGGKNRGTVAGKGPRRRHRPVRVFLVDEAPPRGHGLALKVPSDPGLALVGNAEAIAAAATGAAAVKPDVMVLGPTVGADAARRASRVLRAACPTLPLLLVTDAGHPVDSLPALLDAGIYGQVGADVSDEVLSLAIRTVAAGASFLCPRLTCMESVSQEACAGARALGHLSPQERRILPILAEGKTNREIALALRLSEKTVKNYLANIFEKLRITRRTQAVALYLRVGTGLPPSG